MALNISIGSLYGAPSKEDTGSASGDHSAVVSAAAVWKSPVKGMRCRTRKQGNELDLSPSPPMSPCSPSPKSEEWWTGVSPTRPDLSMACRAFDTHVAEMEGVVAGEIREHAPLPGRGEGLTKGYKGVVPVFVMLPLDSVTMNHTVNRKKAMNASLQALKSAGVEGVKKLQLVFFEEHNSLSLSLSLSLFFFLCLSLSEMTKRNLEAITCKAAVCWGPNEPLVIEEIEVEPPRSSEIRIKMLCASICHTDILYWKGYESVGLPAFPRVFGHEGVGVVESVGEGVTEVEEGDVVIPTYIGECRECMACKSGKTNLCHKYILHLSGLMPDNTTRMSVKGQKLHHLLSCSTWSQYTVVHANYVVKVDPRVPLMDASIISCGYSTGFGAAWKVANVGKGSTVAVFGLGAVGLGAVGAAHIMGAERIIGVDLNDKKKEKGEILGMTDFVNPNEVEKFVPEVIMELTGGLGVDFSFECTGVAPLLNQAVKSTTPGIGVTVAIGAGHDTHVPLGLLDLLVGRTLKGCIFGGIKPLSDLPFIFDKSVSKELQLDSIVTHQLDMENINHAFELLKEPECLKVVIWMEKNCKITNSHCNN